MKRITDLDVKQPLPDPSGDEKEDAASQARMKPLRFYLKLIAFNIAPKTVEDSDALAQIGSKLRLVDPHVDFEESEFRLLKKHVEANALEWPGHMHHFVLTAIREAEKRKIEVKVHEPEKTAAPAEA